MKIAFTSCMSTRAMGVQPVWSHIASQQPDALVLLGDSVYIDVPGETPVGNDEFARHLRNLYQRQLEVPNFAKLTEVLRGPQKLGTHAIWDDHDFFGNDADSDRVLKATAIGRALYSANLMRCWQTSLRSGLPMPEVNSHEVQDGYCRPASKADYRKLQPGYRSQVWRADGTEVVLHLTDGRSWREPGILLGREQQLAIEGVLAAHAGAIHLLASGSACTRHDGNDKSAWENYPADLLWLRRQASQYRLLVLSGDIHRNRAPAPVPPATDVGWGARSLWEATSSGAAVNFNPFGRPEPGSDILGSYTERFGLLDITQSGVAVRFYAHGALDKLDTAGGYRIPTSFAGDKLPL